MSYESFRGVRGAMGGAVRTEELRASGDWDIIVGEEV